MIEVKDIKTYKIIPKEKGNISNRTMEQFSIQWKKSDIRNNYFF